ncbi:MAG: signal recognition particle protein [Clostridia bacterium]|nr:signal recognition particle protein [Clostridia bacterium]
MIFGNLASKLSEVMRKFGGKSRVTESDVKELMREVRLALLEADVNYKVVKDFTKTVSEKAVGSSVLEGLNPGQQVVKIVNDELKELLGGNEAKLDLGRTPPNVIMMVGLQGAGKTTASAKLALMLKKQNKNPLLVAADVYRPAAIKQLEVLGGQIQVPVFSMPDGTSPVEIAKNAKERAFRSLNEVVIIDTAGRLEIDDRLMEELENIKKAVNPSEILLVVDSMTGQNAANVAVAFNERLDISGVILSKLDSDTRGGAALSVAQMTGKPIKFASVGEKMNEFETFKPDRMAGRILGMGDVLSLIEQAEQMYSEKEARELEQKIRQQTFTLEDFLGQLRQIKKMGGIGKLLGMMPGVAGQIREEDIDEKGMVRTEAIICSMTAKERKNPSILNASRRKRIAAGSGTSVQDVNKLIRQFEMMREMMKKMSGGKGGKGGKGFGGGNPFGGKGGFNPGGKFGF